MSPTVRVAAALAGATIYAAAGAVMGSMNAGWFDLGRDANPLLPILGVGAGLVVAAFASSTLHMRLRDAGGLGRVTRILLVGGPLLYVVSWLIQFAILGTLMLGAGLVCLAVAVVKRKLVPVPDRVLIVLSAIGSLTWNTETVSAFLLVGVGLAWMILSARLLRSPSEHLAQIPAAA